MFIVWQGMKLLLLVTLLVVFQLTFSCYIVTELRKNISLNLLVSLEKVSDLKFNLSESEIFQAILKSVSKPCGFIPS